jgi:hypothetical protein
MSVVGFNETESTGMNKRLTTMLAPILIGAAVLVPSPAQAQFGIFFGDEERDFLPERILCLQDSDIRRAVAAEGFTDIFLNAPYEKHVQVRATREGWVYLLDFNYCTANIESSRRLRPAR